MNEELKPCPFCGSDAELRRTGVNWVGCTNDECDAETSSGRNGTVHEAIGIWNKRTESTEVDHLESELVNAAHEIEKLRQELEEVNSLSRSFIDAVSINHAVSTKNMIGSATRTALTNLQNKLNEME